MKKFLLITVLTLVLISCHDSKDNATQKLPKQYDKRVGEQIPFDVAKRWSTNFSRQFAAGREQSVNSISAEILGNILNASADRVGVVFHHATDDAGNYHTLMFTLEDDGALFESEILDLTTGLIIDNTTARLWAAKYSAAHPTTPWYHFFGSDIFSEIQSNTNFNYMEVVRGLNDEDEEQVLLFVYNTKGVSSGRIQGENVVVYDNSNHCPPCGDY